MKRIKSALIGLTMAVALTGCGGGGDYSAVPSTPSVDSHADAAAAGILAGIGGYMLGRSNRPAVAPVQRQTVIVNKTINNTTVNRVARPVVVPRSNFNSPGPRSSFSVSRSGRR